MTKMQPTINAKVAAIGFPIGAIAIHLLHQMDFSLLPLRLISIGVLIFGVWAFSDEMGLRKPLNRAAFVSFMFSMTALLLVTLQPEQASSQYFLLYAFGLLFTVIFWSGAFLHRQKALKWVGGVGVFASVLPVVILIAGHISLGLGAALGVSFLFELPQGQSLLGSKAINIIEAIFVVWAIAASLALWRGNIHPPAAH